MDLSAIQAKLDALSSNGQEREKIDYSNLAYNFLRPYGYKIGVKNVFSNLKKNKIFETWFVSETLDLKTIDYKDWIKKY